MSLAGTENGLGEIGIGEWAEPNIVLAVGMGSGELGDGGAFGLESGEGHMIAGMVESELINWFPSSGLFDSSYGSTTVGSGYKSGSYSSSVTLV